MKKKILVLLVFICLVIVGSAAFSQTIPRDLTGNELGFLLAIICDETGDCSCRATHGFGSKSGKYDFYQVFCSDGRSFRLIHGPYPPFWLVEEVK